MQVKKRVIEVEMSVCGCCGEDLKGNDTFISPFYCSCGVWDYDFDARCYKLKKP